MRNAVRPLMLLAALLLVPVWGLPIWSIRLVAPQYGDGLGMYIGLREIRGHDTHDIQNINILNHYIGMKPIVPAEVDVLQVMPFVLVGLAIAALLVAGIGRRGPVIAWLIAFAVAGAAGFMEFHAWNYDYGHNLSPDAPIKVPGMTYQPPLIGTTTLLTIRASSYPSWGTLFLLLSFVAGIVSLLRLRGARDAGVPRLGAQPVRRAAALLLVAAGAGLAACGLPADAAERTAEFAPDRPRCDFCDGVIPAERFGGELIRTDGTRYRFMSVECLAGFIVSGRIEAREIRSVRVVDYAHGEALTDARTAHYVRSERRESPNGLNLLATERDLVAHNLHFFFGGTRLTWEQVLELVRTEWQQ